MPINVTTESNCLEKKCSYQTSLVFHQQTLEKDYMGSVVDLVNKLII